MNHPRPTGADLVRRYAGPALTATLGLALLLSPVGRSWTERSYDALFKLRPEVHPAGTDVILVEMDDESEIRLRQDSILAWDRRLHARLLDRLRDLGAAVVVFDVLFREHPGPLTTADEELIAAARAHGRVVFGAVQQPVEAPTGSRSGSSVHRPFPEAIPIDQIGLVEESPTGERFIRRHLGISGRLPSLAWRTAALTMAALPGDPATPRWVNYYGRPGTSFPHVSFHRVLSNDLPRGILFSNKTIFVGARTTVGPTAGSGTDYFSTPYGNMDMPGLEVNATVYANLRRGDWLQRWPEGLEAAGFMLFGWVLAALLGRLRPLPATGAAAVIAALVCLGAVGLFWLGRFWFPWLIAIGVQVPVALACSILVSTTTLSREKAALEARLHTRPEFASTRDDTTEAHAADPAGRPASRDQTPTISDHTLLRCIGRGGYGEVWLAQDVIGSFHAVKLVYRNSFQTDGPFEREFRGMQKFTPISRNHPGWVHVLHVGRNDREGYFYYIMEAGDDESTGQEISPATYRPKTLATEIQKRRRLPLAECIEIGIALADALDYLHGQLLVHRDIKPSNVIFVHGAPKFADVGLITEVRNRDRNVSMLGTEGYIAPEGPGTAAADIYSLGKLLYEMSTGRDRLAFPAVPDSLVESSATHQGRRLRAIIEQACDEDPRGRHRSAADLAAELRKAQEL